MRSLLVDRSSRAEALALAAALLVLIGGHLPAAAAQDRSFGEILAAYRTGNADAAVEEFARWAPERVEAEATLGADGRDPWTRAALALLHLEAGLANDTFGSIATHVRVIRQLPSDIEAHARRAYVLVDDVIREAAAANDEALLAFGRGWHVAAFNTIRRLAFPLDSDPVFLLLEGRYYEYWMGPEMCCGRLFGVSPRAQGETTLVRTAHGGFSRSHARAAEEAFRRAVALDPSLAEAYLRLGNVMYRLGRGDDAERYFDLAAARATDRQDVFSGYLANLFRGQLLEDQGRTEAAIAAYGRASEWLPSGQTAVLALGRQRIEQGSVAEGWARIRRAVSATAGHGRLPVDPAYAYTPLQGAWGRGERIQALRRMVRQ